MSEGEWYYCTNVVGQIADQGLSTIPDIPTSKYPRGVSHTSPTSESTEVDICSSTRVCRSVFDLAMGRAFPPSKRIELFRLWWISTEMRTNTSLSQVVTARVEIQ